MNATRDKHGREFRVGDVLKVYHFTAAVRREKRYIYKQITGTRKLGKIPTEYFDVSHLNLCTDDNYTIGMNEGVLDNYEIVQGLDYFKERRKQPEGE